MYHKKSTQGNRISVALSLDLNRCTYNDKTLSANWQLEIQCMCQSSYIVLSCKISLLSRQRTTKALIKLRECAGWSAPLLFTYDKNRFSHDVAHFHINRSYLCRIRRKRVCCIQFYSEKKNNCWFTILGGHFLPRIYWKSICSDSVYMCEERYHAASCEAVRKCFKIYIFIQHYSWNEIYITIANMSNMRISLWKSSQNFWTVQDSLMKYHRWAYLINLCLIDKNENLYF